MQSLISLFFLSFTIYSYKVFVPPIRMKSYLSDTEKNIQKETNETRTVYIPKIIMLPSILLEKIKWDDGEIPWDIDMDM